MPARGTKSGPVWGAMSSENPNSSSSPGEIDHVTPTVRRSATLPSSVSAEFAMGAWASTYVFTVRLRQTGHSTPANHGFRL